LINHRPLQEIISTQDTDKYDNDNTIP
jgi:hypothetical protein